MALGWHVAVVRPLILEGTLQIISKRNRRGPRHACCCPPLRPKQKPSRIPAVPANGGKARAWGRVPIKQNARQIPAAAHDVRIYPFATDGTEIFDRRGDGFAGQPNVQSLPLQFPPRLCPLTRNFAITPRCPAPRPSRTNLRPSCTAWSPPFAPLLA